MLGQALRTALLGVTLLAAAGAHAATPPGAPPPRVPAPVVRVAPPPPPPRAAARPALPAPSVSVAHPAVAPPVVHGAPSVAAPTPHAPISPRLVTLTDTVKTGRLPRDMSTTELKAVQGDALHTVLRLFKDPQGDAPLLGAVRGKVGAYAQSSSDPDTHAVLEARPVLRQQTDALKVLVHTFRGVDGADVGLRSAALQKVGAMGTRADAADLMTLVRKPPHSSDLHGGLEAVKSILARDGSPVPRGDSHLSPEVRTLLTRPTLTADERAAVIKEVLTHGEIVSIVKNQSPTANAVYFLKFKETIPGEGGARTPIEAVWKAEETFAGKEKPTFTREVSAYEFTQRFSKVDIVPVTVEGVLAPDQIPGPVKPYGIGSIQYKVPGGESIGRGYPDSRLLKPKFEAFMKTPDAQQQMREIRTHLYVLNDPEKLPNSGGYDVSNWGNILAVPDASRPGGYKLLLIDNGTGQGALSQFGTSVRPDMLPDGPPTRTATNLGRASADLIELSLTPQIGAADAADVRHRVELTVAPR